MLTLAELAALTDEILQHVKINGVNSVINDMTCNAIDKAAEDGDSVAYAQLTILARTLGIYPHTGSHIAAASRQRDGLLITAMCALGFSFSKQEINHMVAIIGNVAACRSVLSPIYLFDIDLKAIIYHAHYTSNVGALECLSDAGADPAVLAAIQREMLEISALYEKWCPLGLDLKRKAEDNSIERVTKRR